MKLQNSVQNEKCSISQFFQKNTLQTKAAKLIFDPPELLANSLRVERKPDTRNNTNDISVRIHHYGYFDYKSRFSLRKKYS